MGTEILMSATPTPTDKPLLCRLNVHHKWRVERQPEGYDYRWCVECRKIDTNFTVHKRRDITGGGGWGHDWGGGGDGGE